MHKGNTIFKMQKTFRYLILLLSATHIIADNAKRPNIVFILADDLGWDDISLHGSTEIPTPNIDALAADGILLSNYYVQPICTPSRAALMTGRHPIHTGLQHNVIVGSEPYGLPLSETIMPQYLKKLGYRTHIVGKWHLGYFAKEYTPMYRGFDSHFGYYQGCEDYWDHTLEQGHYKDKEFCWGLDFWRNMEADRTAFGQYSTELFTSEAERIIAEHDKTKPLFLYLPHQAVHSGNPGNQERLQAPWKYVSKFSHIKSSLRQKFAGMVSALDDSVGNVTKALHFHGLLDNTIIIFSTDNGGPANRQDYNDACNWPLRGSKRTMWEGGVRGNGFIWSPLLQKTRYVSKHMIQILDWLPTILDAAGYDINTLSKDIDGVSQWKALSSNQPGPRKEMLHNIDPINGDGALRIGDLKVVFGAGDTKRYDGWFLPESFTMDNFERLPDGKQILNNTKMYRHDERLKNKLPKTFDNDLWEIFSTLGRTKVTKTVPYVVECGPKPSNLTANCQPWIHPCLFNITADPCEYHNLADDMPDTVELLMHRIKEYNATAVPPLNKPYDIKGLPGNNDGLWRPWINL